MSSGRKVAYQMLTAYMTQMCLRSHVGEWHGADMANCAEGLPWPALDRVRMLGLPGSIDESSITFEVMTPGRIHPLRTIPVKPSKVLPMHFLGPLT